MFATTFFGTMLADGRLVLSPAQWGAGSERVKSLLISQQKGLILSTRTTVLLDPWPLDLRRLENLTTV